MAFCESHSFSNGTQSALVEILVPPAKGESGLGGVQQEGLLAMAVSTILRALTALGPTLVVTEDLHLGSTQSLGSDMIRCVKPGRCLSNSH